MTTARERNPLPPPAEALLPIWHELAEAISKAHPNLELPYGTRAALDGSGDPAGPRTWNGGSLAYRSFLVYFLEVDGKPANHNLAVDWFARELEIRGGNSRGRHVNTVLPYSSITPEAFRRELFSAAAELGLLPAAETVGSLVDRLPAGEWVDLPEYGVTVCRWLPA